MPSLIVMRSSAFAAALLLSSTAAAWSPDFDDPRWPLDALGRSCADVDTEPGVHLRWYCDARGRVAGVRMPVDTLHVDTSHGRELHAWRDDGSPNGRWLTVRLHGDSVLFLHHATCVNCRRVLGWSYVLRLDRLTDADLAQIQSELGLPGAPVLRRAAAWDAALDRTFPER